MNKFSLIAFISMLAFSFVAFSGSFEDAEKLIVEGKLDNALKVYQSILDRDSTSARAYRGIGLVLWTGGRSDQAIKFYEREPLRFYLYWI